MLNISKIIGKFIRNSSERELGKLKSIVEKINSLEPKVKEMADKDFPAKTEEFKLKIKNGAKLDDLLPEAFACVREASRRTLKERIFDVQLMSGIVLHQNKISEQKTGEGKTLSATLPAYLNALLGKGVHIVTVNDFLASRDAKWMGRIFNFLNLSVGCITNEMDDINRKKNYNCDITYATNSELGFDLLRDQLKYSIEEMVQREHYYCIVDEVDSILIDEARTPLVLSGHLEDKSDQYFVCNKFVKQLNKFDYEIDEKNKMVMLSEKGIDKIEKLSQTYGILKNNNFYSPENINLVHHINQALKANLLFARDTDYIVKDNKIEIIDETTGRVLSGRRYAEGLGQAIEAKENVEIQSENQTLASITYQNYFRMYSRLAGMTGTAQTEAEEFFNIYRLPVVSIPTNKQMIRKDWNDQIFRTEKEKNNAIVNKAIECNKKGQPVLIGATSVSKTDVYSKLLDSKGIKYSCLNAKHHEKEANIIADAGKLNTVTCASQLAGRGQDIKLGGKNLNPNSMEEHNKVKEIGGLFVIGTERHESRRIDNQLRGRAGRQGDPGESIFYISLEDDLMRIFGSESIDTIMKKFGLKEGESIDHRFINKAIERAQQRVEARNYDIRKHLLNYDDVTNDQRKVIFEQRKEVLKSDNITEIINSFLEDVIKNFSDEKEIYERENQIDSFKAKIRPIMGRSFKEEEIADTIKLKKDEFENIIKKRFFEFRDKRVKTITEATNIDLEKRIFIQTIDFLWRSHLQYLEHLRQAVSLRGYAAKDPLQEFKREAFTLFESLLNKIKIDLIKFLNNLEIVNQEDVQFKKSDTLKDGLENNPKCLLAIKKNEKITRNEKCPATGKKYKHCCGAL